MKIANDRVIANGTMTGTTAINSEPIWLGHIANWGVYAAWTKTGGTLGGAFKVQISFDDVDEKRPQDVSNWIDLTSATMSVTDASGSAYLLFQDAGYPWARVVYTNATGTGTCNVRFNAKGI